MKRRRIANASPGVLSVRAARFEDVAPILRLIEGAIEAGCGEHYDAAQRRAVFLGYATNLFVDALGPYETLAAELDGQLAGVAQLDPAHCALRALFVAGPLQGHGLGLALLEAVEGRARDAGCADLGGAMSLNAVPFYARAGYRPAAGPERLLTAGVRVPVVRMRKTLGGRKLLTPS
jgi:GNAT superfamily N-acetyltransferase